MSRANRRKSKEQRRRASIKWAARFHGQYVELDSRYTFGRAGPLKLVDDFPAAIFGIAHAFIKGGFGRLEVDTEDRHFVIFHEKKGIELASDSEIAMARFKGNLPDVKTSDLPPEMVPAAKFWDRQ